MVLDEAKAYATKIISGEIPAAEVTKKACRRFFSVLQDVDVYYYDQTLPELFLEFSQLVPTDEGEPFKLQPFQLFFIANILGLRRKEDGKRLYRTAYLSMSRKNGKSALSSLLAGFFLLFMSEKNKIVTASANSYQQVVEALHKPIKELFQTLDKKQKIVKRFRNSFKTKTNTLLVFPSNPKKLDGLKVGLSIIDELHEAVDSSMYDVISGAMGATIEPLTVMITTCGLDTNSFCFSLESYYRKIVNGQNDNNSVFCLIYENESWEELIDKSTWIKSNPNLGVTVFEKYLSGEYLKAIDFPKSKLSVQVKLFNQWVTSGKAEQWIDSSVLAPKFKQLNINDFKNYPCWVSFDLSVNRDITALTFIFLRDDTFYIFNKCYLPINQLQTNTDKDLYKRFSDAGELVLQNSEVVDYNPIAKEILDFYAEFEPIAIVYDCYNATSLIQQLTDEGMPCYPFSQTLASFNRPTKEFERLVFSNQVVFDDSTKNILLWQFANVKMEYDNKGNCKPTKVDQKTKARQKVDSVISTIQGIGGALEHPY